MLLASAQGQVPRKKGGPSSRHPLAPKLLGSRPQDGGTGFSLFWVIGGKDPVMGLVVLVALTITLSSPQTSGGNVAKAGNQLWAPNASVWPAMGKVSLRCPPPQICTDPSHPRSWMVPCHARPGHPMMYHAMPCQAMSHQAMPCHSVPHSRPSHTVPWWSSPGAGEEPRGGEGLGLCRPVLAGARRRNLSCFCSKPWVAEAGSAGAAGGCGAGWPCFQIHWFTEEPAREGQGSSLPLNCVNYPGSLRAGSHIEHATLGAVLSMPRAGASPSLTWVAVPWQCHRPLLSPPSQREHPARPGPCSALKVAPKQLLCPHQTARVTSGATLGVQPLDAMTFGRGAEQSHTGSLQSVGKGGQGRIASDAQGYHQGPCILSISGVAPGCQDNAVLCRTRQGGVCGICPSGVCSAHVEVTQWKAASRSVPCLYLQLFQL